MNTHSAIATLPRATRWNPHPPQLRAEAVYLARLGWGRASRISKYLSRRHHIDLSQNTVQDWLRGVRCDLDPLDTAVLS